MIDRPKTAQITFRTVPVLKEVIVQAAQADRRSVAFILERAIEMYLAKEHPDLLKRVRQRSEDRRR
jgi:uncharacterized protein (DUF1778 family)